MGTFAVTGSASGMGAATAAVLTDAGHTVIGVDLHDAEVIADLGTAEGRRTAIEAIVEISGGTLDGVAAIAGVGPNLPDAAAVLSINHFGPVTLLNGLRPALERSGAGRAVVIGSNSATTVPLIDDHLVELALAGDEDAAREHARAAQSAMPQEILDFAPSIAAYASSKFALARWVRRTAVTPEWARRGVLLNAIAPGAVLTPLMLGSTGNGADLNADEFPTPMPLGVFGRPEDIAFWVHQFLRPEARFTTGAVLYVDGGTDAAMRPDSQPTAMTL
ncbi:NAD(P)-dependent dehydrogenase, short-chain alcohol dehydrogenase family [Thermomonospora echinospora]|uniref:NAD(P)-dependent dehydrogenase, short-chain alcohol dehydrogenase family n=1 Tax=Thermomonospora echinospora TaxID=1992 RepID=A0A1H6ECC3_9ACTN|nr:SDR family oxidoreductase [Thermomonospora echinospora]SEG94554.1 NAD(P)-dependent dehydrogenase, short-chain alcohol dehydrogenase family [Thermomonospora echinospora]